MDVAIGLSNRIAPEHLELHLEDPLPWFGMIENAGAVFMGDHTPEPVGDYFAGPIMYFRQRARPGLLLRWGWMIF